MISLGGARPLLRGHLHLACAAVAPFALAVLLVLASTPRGYIGGLTFGLGLIILYAASAANHLAPCGPKLRGLFRRLDHAAIFIFIAASYTPFALVLSIPWTTVMLSIVWGLALSGAILRLSWAGMPRNLALAYYIALGWIGLVAVAEVVRAVHPAAIVLLIAGGLLFTLGGIVYGLRRPDPFPRVFGYHEVFHALVIAGTAFHYGAVAGFAVRI